MRFLLRLNNLNSFTTDFERASEFGTRVLEFMKLFHPGWSKGRQRPFSAFPFD
jgi:hypothetical protein